MSDFAAINEVNRNDKLFLSKENSKGDTPLDAVVLNRNKLRSCLKCFEQTVLDATAGNNDCVERSEERTAVRMPALMNK